MRLQVFLSLTALAAATPEPTRVGPRAPSCTTAPDPALAGGRNDPAPCWQDFDTACRAKIRGGTKTTIDAKMHTVTVSGLSQWCVSSVREELARVEDGRKTHGWVRQFGNLHVSDDGVLVITDMSDAAIAGYQKLVADYQKMMDQHH